MLEYQRPPKSSIGYLPREYRTTCDLPDGQPCPPFIEDGIPWRVVMRVGGHTIWCRPLLKPASVSAWRTASEDQSRAPQGSDKWI
jgi:hypothetical protein